jgi:hypothetical protein
LQQGLGPEKPRGFIVARMQTPPAAEVWPHHALWRAVFSPPFIYSTIIVSAVIIVADDFQSDLELFEVTLGTVFVVWVGHVFSETVARGLNVHPRPTPIRQLFHDAIVDSSGVLIAAVLPLLFLLLGALRVLNEYFAYWCSLGVSIVVLGVVGWMLFQRRGCRWPVRLAGAVTTAALGVLVVALKTLVH